MLRYSLPNGRNVGGLSDSKRPIRAVPKSPCGATHRSTRRGEFRGRDATYAITSSNYEKKKTPLSLLAMRFIPSGPTTGCETAESACVAPAADILVFCCCLSVASTPVFL